MGPYPITVRFSGRRVDVKGRLSPGDRFVQDETIEEVVPGAVGHNALRIWLDLAGQ
jgi:hypothetical protein